jgi:acetate kinase
MVSSPNVAGVDGLVLALNTGSSTVRFALISPGTGERVVDGLADHVATPEAVLRVRQAGQAGAVTERLADGSYQAVLLHHRGCCRQRDSEAVT